VAPQVGNARRALLHRDQLLGIGDNTVQSFDISNRDQPVASARLDVARNVGTVRVVGDQLMRFGNDWFTQQTILDMTPLAQAGNAQPQSEIDLSALFGSDTYSCGGSASWGGEVFTKGHYAYVPRYSYTYSDIKSPGGGSYQQKITLYIVDMTASGGPAAVGSVELDALGQNAWFAGIVQTENSLLIGRSTGNWGYDNGQITSKPSFSYDVIDLRDPAAPRVDALRGAVGDRWRRLGLLPDGGVLDRHGLGLVRWRLLRQLPRALRWRSGREPAPRAAE